nr:Hpt domain-containing protein [Ruegeria faecimaris]
MIDWSRVRQLRDEVGADEFDEVVEIFLDEVQQGLEHLQVDDDRSDFEKHLHSLKGSALSLGFRTLAKLCQDGERHSAQGQAATVDIAEIVGTFRTSATEFQAGLNEL